MPFAGLDIWILARRVFEYLVQLFPCQRVAVRDVLFRRDIDVLELPLADDLAAYVDSSVDAAEHVVSAPK